MLVRGSCPGHVIPNHCQDSPLDQDPGHLTVEHLHVEPVQSLADGDQVETVVSNLHSSQFCQISWMQSGC